MKTSLITTARDNRNAALAYLDAKKKRGTTNAQVYCLATMRELLEQKPLFTSRRGHRFQEHLAA